MSDTWYTPDNMNQACEHGHQRRKCPHCESIWQDERIAELERELKRKGEYYYTRLKLSDNEVQALRAENKQLQERIAELEQELKDAEARFQAALQYSGEVNTKNQRLREALADITTITWGCDGDCGSIAVANKALEES